MSNWPELVVEEWKDTRDTLHVWSQVVGKIRMEATPAINQWWHVALYVSPRGLTTSLMPYGDRNFELEFDFTDHMLRVTTDDPDQRVVALEAKPVAVFYQEVMAALRSLGIDVPIMARPVEVAVSVPFAQDVEPRAYDPESAERFWRLLANATRVLTEFRGRFVGKASPVHFFWGGFDLAATRFSGRSAPLHPGGFPNCPDWVMHEAYSQEVSSAGYFADGGTEGAFYAYAYPTPDGFASYPVRPDAARYDDVLGEFLLPYEAVRTAPDPDAYLLEFLQSTYEAAADLADWDRSALEASPGPHTTTSERTSNPRY